MIKTENVGKILQMQVFIETDRRVLPRGVKIAKPEGKKFEGTYQISISKDPAAYEEGITETSKSCLAFVNAFSQT